MLITKYIYILHCASRVVGDERNYHRDGLMEEWEAQFDYNDPVAALLGAAEIQSHIQ